jgi:hypothetical protein
MKTSKKTGKPEAPKSKKGTDSSMKGRKMEPLKSKELKNQRFDETDEDEDVDPEMMDDNFKGFDEFYDEADEEDD